MKNIKFLLSRSKNEHASALPAKPVASVSRPPPPTSFAHLLLGVRSESESKLDVVENDDDSCGLARAKERARFAAIMTHGMNLRLEHVALAIAKEGGKVGVAIDRLNAMHIGRDLDHVDNIAGQRSKLNRYTK